jgi:hypothetical protein
MIRRRANTPRVEKRAVDAEEIIWMPWPGPNFDGQPLGPLVAIHRYIQELSKPGLVSYVQDRTESQLEALLFRVSQVTSD